MRRLVGGSARTGPTADLEHVILVILVGPSRTSVAQCVASGCFEFSLSA